MDGDYCEDTSETRGDRQTDDSGREEGVRVAPGTPREKLGLKGVGVGFCRSDRQEKKLYLADKNSIYGM